MKRTKREPKHTVQSTLVDLRKLGFKPNYDAQGKLIDWRRINGHKLHTAKVIVHPSGRITVHHRSTADGKTRHEPARSKSTTA